MAGGKEDAHVGLESRDGKGDFRIWHDAVKEVDLETILDEEFGDELGKVGATDAAVVLSQRHGATALSLRNSTRRSERRERQRVLR